jgi:hypothetical protein
MDPAGEFLDDLAQEGGTIGLGVGVQEGDVGQLGDPIASRARWPIDSSAVDPREIGSAVG